jgi:hypothetical protein
MRKEAPVGSLALLRAIGENQEVLTSGNWRYAADSLKMLEIPCPLALKY